MKFNSLEELYKKLKIVFDIKLRLLNNNEYYYIKKEDIWLFLSETKWKHVLNLGIAEIVDDIIHCDVTELDYYMKNNLKNSKRSINF